MQQRKPRQGGKNFFAKIDFLILGIWFICFLPFSLKRMEEKVENLQFLSFTSLGIIALLAADLQNAMQKQREINAWNYDRGPR